MPEQRLNRRPQRRVVGAGLAQKRDPFTRRPFEGFQEQITLGLARWCWRAVHAQGIPFFQAKFRAPIRQLL
ncbi:MAG: hypothetical protein M5U12_21210 [Verrucomicrobia bacterium]|nr:hypothetical protein [Verrucomicrobiota bacterium]